VAAVSATADDCTRLCDSARAGSPAVDVLVEGPPAWLEAVVDAAVTFLGPLAVPLPAEGGRAVVAAKRRRGESPLVPLTGGPAAASPGAELGGPRVPAPTANCPKGIDLGLAVLDMPALNAASRIVPSLPGSGLFA
jgi:hypothetical protein